VLCETVHDITPYRPMLASSSAKPPNRATKATAASSWDVERSRQPQIPTFQAASNVTTGDGKRHQ
jgi:hypothetical protein